MPAIMKNVPDIADLRLSTANMSVPTFLLHCMLLLAMLCGVMATQARMAHDAL